MAKKNNEKTENQKETAQDQTGTDEIITRTGEAGEVSAEEVSAEKSNEAAANTNDATTPEPVVKSGFQKIAVSAVCDDGKPFLGHYGSLRFNERGVALVTAHEVPCLEKLRRQFPTLEIKEA